MTFVQFTYSHRFPQRDLPTRKMAREPSEKQLNVFAACNGAIAHNNSRQKRIVIRYFFCRSYAQPNGLFWDAQGNWSFCSACTLVGYGNMVANTEKQVELSKASRQTCKYLNINWLLHRHTSVCISACVSVCIAESKYWIYSPASKSYRSNRLVI